MSEYELNKIIGKNITELLEKQNKNQIDLAEYIGVTQTTVSNWCRGEKAPRMKKLDMICEFFGVNRSDLMESEEQKEKHYYLNEKTREIAQDIFENKELRLLYDAGKDAAPEDLKLVHDMLLRLKRSENHNDEY